MASATAGSSRRPSKASQGSVVRSISRDGPAAWRSSAASASSCFGNYTFHGESELLIDPLILRGFAKPLDPYDHAVLPHPAVPGLGRRRLDRDAPDTEREHGLPVVLGLFCEELETGHRYGSRPSAIGLQLLIRPKDQFDLRPRRHQHDG